MKATLVLQLLSSLLLTAWAQQCLPDKLRIDCHPQPEANEAKCLERGCLWCQADSGVPWCYLPQNYGYKMDGQPEELPNGYRVSLVRATDISYVGGDAQFVTATFEIQADYRLRITITDGSDRYEVPMEINPPTSVPMEPLFSIKFTNDPVFSFKVVRESTGTVVFDSSLGGLTFADQFIQIGIKLPSTNAFGIGENEQHTYRHDFSKFQTLSLWARDHAPSGNKNIYGVHPYYTVVENDGNTHSVVIINSNAQEFIISPAPGYTYRTIGGLLDIYVFLGPTPEDTVRQFTEAIGRQPIPPYWGLGFQLSRWGYNNIQNMQGAVNRTRLANIPQDVQYGDIDIMERNLDFTYSKDRFRGLPEYIKSLKRDGIKFIPIVDPGIKFDETEINYPALIRGKQMDVWIKRPDGTPMIGSVWPGNVYFPDFSRSSTETWWTGLIRDFKNLLDFDGIWIDMNEPANWESGDAERKGCANNKWNNPPYVPGITDRSLWSRTICADYEQDFGLHYNTHSLYGWSQSKVTLQAVRKALGKRSLVLTRSTFLGVGNWAAHWLGDNLSAWSNLHYSIIGLMQFNTFGIPYAGSDICGFVGDAEEDMCTRWQQLGAFYPFSRNHNALGTIDQDPGKWNQSSIVSSRTALQIRYTLLPYLYYLFFIHKTQGDTVVRALWHEYPTDPIALGIDKQFLWGSGFLITPVLERNKTSVEAYFPKGNWYSYYDGSKQSNGQVTLGAPAGFINLHVRGGHILPTQEPALNTLRSRENPFGLIVALDKSGSAQGGMYYDDGDSIEPQDSGNYFHSRLTFSGRKLSQSVVVNGYPKMNQKVLSSVRVFGAGSVTKVTVNGSPHKDVTLLPSGEVKVNKLNLRMDSSFVIAFA